MPTLPTRALSAAAVLLSVGACTDSKASESETAETAAAPAATSQTAAAPAASATPTEVPAVQQRLEYPPLAKAAGIQGTVVVRAVMDDAGKLVDAQAETKLGGGLEEAAVAAVRAAWDSPDLAALKQQAQPGATGQREVHVPAVFRA